MRGPFLIALVAVIGVMAFALRPHSSDVRSDACGPVDAPPRETGIMVARQTTLCLLNRERTNRGLPALRENSLLGEASTEHSEDMVLRGYFEHTAADGRTLGDRLRAVRYGRGTSVSAGENIAYGVGRAGTPAAIVSLWMHSPGHRADILRPAYTEVGIGIALGAPAVPADEQRDAATYTTDFGGAFDSSLPNG